MFVVRPENGYDPLVVEDNGTFTFRDQDYLLVGFVSDVDNTLPDIPWSEVRNRLPDIKGMFVMAAEVYSTPIESVMESS